MNPLLDALLLRTSAHDDPHLWEAALDAVTTDARVVASSSLMAGVHLVIGPCSHWLRPHQMRWTAAGGFAWPVGYSDSISGGCGLPEFDWFIRAAYEPAGESWLPVERVGRKRVQEIRMAVPSRTRRHRQAVVHTLWPTGTLRARQVDVRFYGFRHIESGWSLMALGGGRR